MLVTSEQFGRAIHSNLSSKCDNPCIYTDRLASENSDNGLRERQRERENTEGRWEKENIPSIIVVGV